MLSRTQPRPRPARDLSLQQLQNPMIDAYLAALPSGVAPTSSLHAPRLLPTRTTTRAALPVCTGRNVSQGGPTSPAALGEPRAPARCAYRRCRRGASAAADTLTRATSPSGALYRSAARRYAAFGGVNLNILPHAACAGPLNRRKPCLGYRFTGGAGRYRPAQLAEGARASGRDPTRRGSYEVLFGRDDDDFPLAQRYALAETARRLARRHVISTLSQQSSETRQMRALPPVALTAELSLHPVDATQQLTTLRHAAGRRAASSRWRSWWDCQLSESPADRPAPAER